jgi:hypothetical protein
MSGNDDIRIKHHLDPTHAAFASGAAWHELPRRSGGW